MVLGLKISGSFLEVAKLSIYKSDGRPNDAARILKLATAKKNATEREQRLLDAIRRNIAGEPLAEPARIAAACPPQA
jgi:hypothetical protein